MTTLAARINAWLSPVRRQAIYKILATIDPAALKAAIDAALSGVAFTTRKA